MRMCQYEMKIVYRLTVSMKNGRHNNISFLKVAETWWAIGSTPGGTDVQPFVKISTDMFVSNSSLEGLLLENHTYYVALMCINGAGLKTTNISQGESKYCHIHKQSWI